MRAVVVVLLGEGVQQVLQVRDGGGLVWLGSQPFLQGLLEAFNLALGLGVPGAAVLLDNPQTPEFGLEVVAAALAAGEAGGEDHAVVGQRGGRNPM